MQNSSNSNKPIPPPVPPRPDKLNRNKNHPHRQTVAESKDLKNHELLINELQHNNKGNNYSNLNNFTINHSNWYEVGDNGNEVQYSRCQIIIDNTSGNHDKSGHDEFKSTPPPLPPKNSTRKELMLLNGLPPLPKCLSSFNVNGGSNRGFQHGANKTNTDTLSSNNGTYNSSSLSSISSTSSSSDLGTMISGSNSTPISRSPSLAGLNEKFAFLKKEMVSSKFVIFKITWVYTK